MFLGISLWKEKEPLNMSIKTHLMLCLPPPTPPHKWETNMYTWLYLEGVVICTMDIRDWRWPATYDITILATDQYHSTSRILALIIEDMVAPPRLINLPYTIILEETMTPNTDIFEVFKEWNHWWYIFCSISMIKSATC